MRPFDRLCFFPLRSAFPRNRQYDTITTRCPGLGRKTTWTLVDAVFLGTGWKASVPHALLHKEWGTSTPRRDRKRSVPGAGCPILREGVTSFAVCEKGLEGVEGLRKQKGTEGKTDKRRVGDGIGISNNERDRTPVSFAIRHSEFPSVPQLRQRCLLDVQRSIRR